MTDLASDLDVVQPSLRMDVSPKDATSAHCSVVRESGLSSSESLRHLENCIASTSVLDSIRFKLQRVFGECLGAGSR